MRALICVVCIVLLAISFSGCSSGSWELPDDPVVGTDPAIRITNVNWKEAPDGHVMEILVIGQVYNVQPPTDYKVSIWINVPGAGWWPKPTFADPFTGINGEGKFANNIVTGGNDSEANIIMVYLLRREVTWPIDQDSVIAEHLVEKPDPAKGRVQVIQGIKHTFVKNE